MTKNFGISFSDKFGIDESWLRGKKIFNPTLDVDSPLFIDPFLLPHSIHPEFSDCAFEAYEAHFTEIYRLLRIAENPNDKAWKAAHSKFELGEGKGLNGTCLGYSKRSIRGRGFGRILSAKALLWAKQVIDLGVKDPEMFSSMSLFESGIGADLISDMTANIALDCIISFNHRVISEVETELGIALPITLLTVGKKKAELIQNPFGDGPIVLVAEDVLKHLPILDDARSLTQVANENAELRDRVNAHIGEIFKVRTKKEKDEIKRQAMGSAASFQTLLDLLKIVEKKPYNFHKDPEGLLEWRSLAHNFAALYRLEIHDDQSEDELTRIEKVVTKIIEQFRHLVEDNRLSRSFHVDGEPRHERFAQLLFFAIAVSYCDANNLDISPEADAGAGPVDFKISRGTQKIVVEIKLSTSSYVVSGYEKQLEAYMRSEATDRGHYVLIDVGKIGKKWEELTALQKKSPRFARHKKLHLIDGTLRPSASRQ